MLAAKVLSKCRRNILSSNRWRLLVSHVDFLALMTLDQFWDLVQRGACSIAELPSDRLERSLYYSPAKGKDSEGKTYSTLSGTVSTPQFDEKLCAEPDAYDIAHLIMLEVAASACRDAGWDPLALPLRNAGVYIGHARTSSLPAEITFSIHVEDCVECLSQVPAFKNLPDSLRHSIINGIIRNVHHNKPHHRESGKPFWDPAMAATLVSQTLGLNGPHMVIDAACASSLVAVALAAGPAAGRAHRYGNRRRRLIQQLAEHGAVFKSTGFKCLRQSSL